MEDKFQNKYRVSSPRLQGWDYGSHALYFVTICIKDRLPAFGEMWQNEANETTLLKLTMLGNAAHSNWLQIPHFHPYVELDEFVIMPDHLHGILFFNKPDKITWEPNKPGGQRNNLASVVRGYKGSIKQYAQQNNIDFNWQPRFYDRVIRNEKEYTNIKEYISKNPRNWILNKDEFENLYL
jgi:REP element-mobilizing transposase RayT